MLQAVQLPGDRRHLHANWYPSAWAFPNARPTYGAANEVAGVFSKTYWLFHELHVLVIWYNTFTFNWVHGFCGVQIFPFVDCIFFDPLHYPFRPKNSILSSFPQSGLATKRAPWRILELQHGGKTVICFRESWKPCDFASDSF